VNKPVPLTLFFPDHYAEGWAKPPTFESDKPHLMFNAARPLLGNPHWSNGDQMFNRGRYYAVVSWGSDAFDFNLAMTSIQRNIDLDAGLVVEIADKVIYKRAQAICEAETLKYGYPVMPDDYDFFQLIDSIRDRLPVLNWTNNSSDPQHLLDSITYFQRTGFLP